MKAIIIKGNPKYIDNNPDAEKFYSDISSYLTKKGYMVELDPGTPYTSPPEADIWIGHSRGSDRLRFAPDETRTLAFGSTRNDEDSWETINHPDDTPQVGKAPNRAHYIFTDEMKSAIDLLAVPSDSFESDIEDEESKIAFINIYRILKAAYGYAEPLLIKSALSKAKILKPKNINDYYYLTFRSILENKKIKKVAYPMLQGALSDEIPEEYDLEKWSGLVYKIYDAVNSGDMTYHNALDYYSGFLDAKSEEGFRFKKWVNYYKDGEHRKYNKNEVIMKKKSDYQFALNDSFYGEGYIPGLEEEHPIHKVKEDRRLKEEYKGWKSKLYAAVRRIDKLLRQSEEYIDSDYQNDLADHLHSFDMELRRVKMHSTASDLAFRKADQFEKMGFKEGAEILNKFAQEAPPLGEDIVPEEITAAPEDFGVPEGEGEVPPAEAPEAPVEASPEEGGVEQPQPDRDAESPLARSIHESVGNPREYSDLSGDITLDIAARKLEEAAGKLADRRTIRLLAEFDIMLDRLGIAAMFPELAESQSKLIDAYSYALTRVTKMLGMLSSGKTLVELGEARQVELEGKTMKEVQKTFEPPEGAAPKEEPGEAMQRELELPEGSAPEAPTEPPQPTEV